MFILPPGFTSCATYLLSCLEQSSLDVVPDILSGPISYTCRCAHMQVEDLLEMIACLKVFKLPNFEARGELALGFWRHINPHVTYKKLKLQSYFLTRDHFCRQVCAWSYGKGWGLSAWLCFQTCMWWDGHHVSWNMCSLEAGQMLGCTLGFSHPQHLVPACHTPMHFPVSNACTANMAVPISTWDQKFWCWDPGSHSKQLIKEQVLNLIT